LKRALDFFVALRGSLCYDFDVDMNSFESSQHRGSGTGFALGCFETVLMALGRMRGNVIRAE
jgi:hypothetical protein